MPLFIRCCGGCLTKQQVPGERSAGRLAWEQPGEAPRPGMSACTGGAWGGCPRGTGCCPSPGQGAGSRQLAPTAGDAELTGAGGWFRLRRQGAGTPRGFLTLPGEAAGLSGSRLTSLAAERTQKTSGQREQFLHAGDLKMRFKLLQAYFSVWKCRRKSFRGFLCVKRHRVT